MNTDKTCTATFSLPLYNLTVEKEGRGMGSVVSSPSGISCGSDCGEQYSSGTVVDLTAIASPGSRFLGWSGDADCSNDRVTMDADKTCIATFGLWW